MALERGWSKKFPTKPELQAKLADTQTQIKRLEDERTGLIKRNEEIEKLLGRPGSGMSAPAVRFPRDVAALRNWLIEEWRPHKNFARAMMTYNDPADRPYYMGESEALKGATLWWVSAEMVDLLLATAASIPDDMAYEDLAIPSDSGLIVLEKSWIGHDAKSDGPVTVDAIIWSHQLIRPLTAPGQRGLIRSLTLSAYNHVDFAQGLSPGQMTQATDLGAWDHGIPSYLGTKREGIKYASSYNLTGHTWMPMGRSNWPVKEKVDFRPWDQPDHTYTSFVEDRKVIAALFTLLRQQGVARTEVIPADRPVRRQAQRVGVPKETSSNVSVVTLRKLTRTESDGTGEKKVEWTHRWMVSGHFRWQPVGKGLCERRLTFVSPHIKGPEDKPFEPPTRVNAWRR